MSIEALRSYLISQPVGKLESEEQLQNLLIRAWDELDGGADGGMQSHKLKNRIENPTWQPPILSFRIERHGGTVNGSIFAEVQLWEIDCERGTASYDQFKSRRRQVGRRRAGLKVAPLAIEIAKLIKAGTADARLKWISPTEAKVIISTIIPDNCCEATLSGRRKRFYEALQTELADTGWDKRPNSPVFEMIQPKRLDGDSVPDAAAYHMGRESHMEFYHRTSAQAAKRILRSGFKDSTGTYMTRTEHTGVWLSSVPLDANEGAAGDVLLRVSIETSDAEMAAYEWVEDGKPYREWLVPAALINSRMQLSVVDEDC